LKALESTSFIDQDISIQIIVAQGRQASSFIVLNKKEFGTKE
jgi:hypothetical protein